MHCGDQRHLGLCLGYVTRLRLVQGLRPRHNPACLWCPQCTGNHSNPFNKGTHCLCQQWRHNPIQLRDVTIAIQRTLLRVHVNGTEIVLKSTENWFAFIHSLIIFQSIHQPAIDWLLPQCHINHVDYLSKDIHSADENECRCLRRVSILNVNFTNKTRIEQCVMIIWNLSSHRSKSEYKLYQDTRIVIQENTFENIFCKHILQTVNLFRPQCVNPLNTYFDAAFSILWSLSM